MKVVAAAVLLTAAFACTAQERRDPAAVRYNAAVKDGKWTEVGDRIVPGKDPVRFFEMRLTRVGDSEWPGAGAVSPK